MVLRALQGSGKTSCSALRGSNVAQADDLSRAAHAALSIPGARQSTSSVKGRPSSKEKGKSSSSKVEVKKALLKATRQKELEEEAQSLEGFLRKRVLRSPQTKKSCRRAYEEFRASVVQNLEKVSWAELDVLLDARLVQLYMDGEGVGKARQTF